MTAARAGIVLAAGSVTVIAAVGVTAVVAGPSDGRLWLACCVGFALATGVQSVTSEPRDLTAALLFSLPPVISLTADGSPTWLIGPLAVLLLLAGELNALSWDFQGEGPKGGVKIRRLTRVALLVAFGFAGVLTVSVASRASVFDGTVAFALAAGALVLLGEVVFGRSG